jgi:hypothetical protein
VIDKNKSRILYQFVKERFMLLFISRNLIIKFGLVNQYLSILKMVLVDDFLNYKNSNEYVFKQIYFRFAVDTNH